KLCNGQGFIGQSEVDYYTRDYVGLADAPLVTCYDAQYDPVSGAYHILLDDLSATHQPTWRVPSTLAHGQALARGLARLHAYRWTPEQRAAIGAAIPNAAKLGRYVEVARAGLEPMLDDVAGEVEPRWAAVWRKTFDRHPGLMIQRAQNPVGITVVHGDVNCGNILAPIVGEEPVYIVDRQPFDWSLTVWLGTSDLSYMMVTYWETEARRELEMAVLREYHQELQRRGVRDYSWDELLADYRLCVAQAIYVPTEWCGTEQGRREMKWVWWPELQRTMAAFEDWQCHQLWGG
ncbi:MAG: phosphotransferase, partial [Anaerolineae bacterium]|nr:phosphotransferase [Anaerolineae bacterium]